ncbi:response regulator transcription factor, partial [Cryobacterium sp. 5B3]
PTRSEAIERTRVVAESDLPAHIRAEPTGPDLRSEPTVFLLDDQEIMRDGVRHLLSQAGIRIVGESGSVLDALGPIHALRPDLVILESRFGDGTGANACRRIRSADPGIRCVILTHDSDENSLFAAIQGGAAGYLSKRIGSDELVDTVRRVAAGEIFFSTALRERESERMHRAAGIDPKLAVLSEQERRIVTRIAQGMSNRQIAQDLFLAEKTVRNYVSIVLAKLGFERRGQAAVLLSRDPSSP